MTPNPGTPWEHGRFDARRGPSKVLFGRMYEDVEIERAAFKAGSRVFCIASAGCTAVALAPDHDVVAVDVNARQLLYAAHRIAGGQPTHGTAERVMAFGRWFAPLVGWSRSRVRAFLELDSSEEQRDFWQRKLDTRRFRAVVDTLLSVTSLRAVYATPFLSFLPRHLGALMRARMTRGFGLHANRNNPYARALLLGELPEVLPPKRATTIELVHSDAAAFLEQAPAASFSGFTLSNILDGVDAPYRRRLFAAVKRAAAPDAVVVMRSFGQPSEGVTTNQAAADRSMLWGVVDVRPVASLDSASA